MSIICLKFTISLDHVFVKKLGCQFRISQLILSSFCYSDEQEEAALLADMTTEEDAPIEYEYVFEDFPVEADVANPQEDEEDSSEAVEDNY